MKHIYLVANCKTPGCTTARMLKYMGRIQARDNLMISFPHDLTLNAVFVRSGIRMKGRMSIL